MRKKAKKRPLWRRVLGGAFYVTFLLFVLFTATFAAWIQRSPMMAAIARQYIAPKPPQQVFAGQDSLTLLLMGLDAKPIVKKVTYDRETGKPIYHTVPDPKSKRADMILVAKLDFRNNTITGVSVPRDLECQLPGYRTQKINAYYQLGDKGEEALKMRDAVMHVLPGINIDREVVLDFDAFKEMVDVVGGVTVDVPKAMKYEDNFGGVHVDFKPGRQTLDGYNALMYARFRKGEGGDSDFGRQDRQKQLLMSLKNSVMRDPMRLPLVLNKAEGVLGGALDSEEIASLALFARTVKPTDIQMVQLPTYTFRGRRGAYYERFRDGEPEATLRKVNLIEGGEVASR